MHIIITVPTVAKKNDIITNANDAHITNNDNRKVTYIKSKNAWNIMFQLLVDVLIFFAKVLKIFGISKILKNIKIFTF